MTEKTAPNKKDLTGKNVSEMMPQIEKKIDFFKDVIQKTIIHVLVTNIKLIGWCTSCFS